MYIYYPRHRETAVAAPMPRPMACARDALLNEKSTAVGKQRKNLKRVNFCTEHSEQITNKHDICDNSDQNLWQFLQITLVLWDCVELATMELQGEECVENSSNSKVPVTRGDVRSRRNSSESNIVSHWRIKFGESLAWSLPNPIWPNPFSVHKSTCLRVANKQSTTKSRSSHSRTQTFKTTTWHHPTNMK
jgi:hypothetical protein